MPHFPGFGDVSMGKWWDDKPNAKGLSQGDVIREIPFGVSPFPPTALARRTAKGGVIVWHPTEPDSSGWFLFKGGRFPGLVVSHSCDLDKREKKGRVLIAPMRPLNALNEDVRKAVLAQSRRSLMPLPDIPVIGSHYADFRLITAVDRLFSSDADRIASMTEIGMKRLQAQLGAFFLRLDLTVLEQFRALRSP